MKARVLGAVAALLFPAVVLAPLASSEPPIPRAGGILTREGEAHR